MKEEKQSGYARLDRICSLIEVMLRVGISHGGFALIILEHVKRCKIILCSLTNSQAISLCIIIVTTICKSNKQSAGVIFLKSIQAAHAFNYIVLRAMLMSVG